ncbi:transmembrane protein 44 isoform X3 [Sminthopsis crassicaudata]|uniref:transmembrane protein 44 isoform X3 n=1 Tax=Sminthopsis crassicaudata TaxID=9301 RepID=UPI003D68A841
MRRSLGAADPPVAAAGPASEAPALGDWDYLAACFAHDRVCLSFGLWLLAALLWIAAHVLCFYLGCCKKSSRDRSVLCVIYRFVGNLSDAFGALLSKQLPIQVFTGIYLAAIEVVNLMLLLFPICGSKIKPKLGRCSQERTRRKLRASMFVLIVPLGVGTGWLALAPPAPASLEFHGAQRRLLGSVLQENTEALGYLLGGVGLIVSWTSRIPSFSKINSNWVPLHMLPHTKYLHKMAAIGRYMELTIEHVQEAGCSSVRSLGDGHATAGDPFLQAPPSLLEPPTYPPIQVIHAKVSSSSSSEVSSINSELEQKYWEALNSEQWDREDANFLWSRGGGETARPPAPQGCQAHRAAEAQ